MKLGDGIALYMMLGWMVILSGKWIPAVLIIVVAVTGNALSPIVFRVGRLTVRLGQSD